MKIFLSIGANGTKSEKFKLEKNTQTSIAALFLKLCLRAKLVMSAHQGQLF